MQYDTLTLPEATAIQKELREKIILQPGPATINTIAGADISFNRFSTTVYAGIVVLRFPELIPLAYSLVKAEVHFPYVPGYLAFRETPALLKAWQLLPEKPDVLVVDGHGIAHPRRMGIAAHFGALTDQSTIGCAKKLLFGKYEEPGNNQLDYTFINDKHEPIGCVLRTKKNVKPIFVSPGNKNNITDSVQLISKCIGKYRIPEPTRLAHEAVNAFRTGKLQEGYQVILPTGLF
jgi:deoxyribonuclease V